MLILYLFFYSLEQGLTFVVLVGLQLRDLPASASRVLGLKAYANISGLIVIFLQKKQEQILNSYLFIES